MATTWTPPGKRDRIIVLQQKIAATDGYGGQTFTWSQVARIWAYLRPLRGRELVAAEAAQNKTEAIFNIRYRAGIDTAMRIVYGGKNYNISAVIDIEDRHEEMDIMATTGLNEG